MRRVTIGLALTLALAACGPASDYDDLNHDRTSEVRTDSPAPSLSLLPSLRCLEQPAYNRAVFLENMAAEASHTADTLDERIFALKVKAKADILASLAVENYPWLVTVLREAANTSRLVASKGPIKRLRAKYVRIGSRWDELANRLAEGVPPC